MKTQYSATELAGMRLDGFPASEMGIRQRAARAGWTYTEIPCKGGNNGKKREYPLTQPALAHLIPLILTREADEYLAAWSINHPEPAKADVAEAPSPSAGGLAKRATAVARAPARPTRDAAYATAKDRKTQDNRKGIKRAIQTLVDGGCTQRGAQVTLLARAKAGELTPELTALLRDGRDSRGKQSASGWISIPTLHRICTAKNLLPVPSSEPDQTVLPWHPLAIALLARPQKPSKKWVAEQITEIWHPGLGAKPPTEDQIYYFFANKFSKGDQHDGRHTGSDLRSKKFYQHRTAQGLPPFIEVHADGWTTHFTAPHPITGEFVTLEAWHARCIATKYVTPMAIAMSECMEVIAKCVENCIRVGGVPAIFQTDSTGSMKNQTMEFDPITSLSARSGMTVVHPVTVGNSQANGIAENFNTFLDREAKELATYQGKSMDSLVLKRQGKLTKKMVASRSAGDLVLAGQIKAQLERVTKGIVFETYADAVAWFRKVELRWNNKPHSALPRIHDPVLCKKRHMTPQESLDAARAAGWEPAGMDEASLVDLFRVHETRKVIRETVVAYNKQRYYHADLSAYDGEQVIVAIDRMEWQHVWVKDMSGRLLCKAEYVAATGYRALTMYEAALEVRAEAQLKRLDVRAEAVRRRMVAPALELEAPAIVLDLPPALVRDRQPVAEPTRPISFLDSSIRLLALEAAKRAADEAAALAATEPEKKVAGG